MSSEAMAGRDFGEYRLGAEIGRGGIGVVYRAQSRDGTWVALKLLRSEAIGPSQRPRFEREAKALSALSHPNIVSILDCGVIDSVPYLAMELLDGQSLAQALGAKPLPVTRGESIVRELVAALAYVHSRGLVHRDLKPGNVFLHRQRDGGEKVKLLDFGLAKFLDREGDTTTLTRTGEVFGTPAYMPPEQWTGQSVDATADIYSAAVVCFEVLAGRKPFPGQGQDLLRQQLVDPAPLLHEMCPDRVASPPLERLLQRALAKQPRDRQRDATELAAELAGVSRPWLYTGTGATAERRKAAEDVRTQLKLAVAPTLEQPVLDPASEPELEPAPPRTNGQRVDRATQPRSLGGLLRRLLLAGAWTLTLVSSLVIAVAVIVIYVLRSPEREQERAALKQALPPLEEKVSRGAAAAKTLVDDTLAAASEQAARVLAPSEPGEARTQGPATSVAARDPWRAATPKALRRMRTRIAAGDRGSERMLSDLRRYNREHPDDPRGHLLLARLFLNRGWFDEVTTQYQRAFARDPSSRGDPHMLRNLLRAAANEGSSARASELVQTIYGREALAAIAEARSRAQTEERARLDRLASALAP